MHIQIWAKKIWSFQHVKDSKLIWANGSSSKQMFKMLALARMHALRESKVLKSFIDCIVKNLLIKTIPFFQNSLFEVKYASLINTFLKDAPQSCSPVDWDQDYWGSKSWWNKLWSFSWKHADRQFLWLDEQKHSPARIWKIHCPTSL